MSQKSHTLKKSNTKLIHFLEYSVDANFSEQNLKKSEATPIYMGKQLQKAEIDEDSMCYLSFTRLEGAEQILKIVTEKGECLIDLGRVYSDAEFSGGGTVAVEVSQMEIPREVEISDLEENGNGGAERSGEGCGACRLV